eukprot:9487970-Pyramimonas_sp.AAC.1
MRASVRARVGADAPRAGAGALRGRHSQGPRRRRRPSVGHRGQQPRRLVGRGHALPRGGQAIGHHRATRQ